MQANTIDDVVARLDGIIDWSQNNSSRLGYFPALYRKMTLRVGTGIATGVFDDNARMAHIGVVFANCYLAAFDHFRNGTRPTQAWLCAFMTLLWLAAATVSRTQCKKPVPQVY